MFVMRTLSLVLVALAAVACSDTPAAPLADPPLGVWTAASVGPLSTLAIDVHPASDGGFEGVAYATRSDCRPGDRYPCLLAGSIIPVSGQDGALVLIRFTFPSATIGGTFRGEHLSNGTLRGWLEIFDGTSTTGRTVAVTFHH